jgi:hypothetical protein
MKIKKRRGLKGRKKRKQKEKEEEERETERGWENPPEKKPSREGRRERHSTYNGEKRRIRRKNPFGGATIKNET